MLSTNSCMKTLLVLSTKSLYSQTLKPTIVLFIKTSEMRESVRVSQNGLNHMFSVNMTSRLPMWKIASGPQNAH